MPDTTVAPTPTQAPAQPLPQEILLQMITGFFLTQSIGVAARLGVADLLVDGPRSVEELGKKVDSNPDGLFRLLRALASVGIFTQVGERTFAITPLADCLRSDTPGSVRDMAIMMANPSHYRTWGELESCIRTNDGAFERVWGQDVFSFFAGNAAEARAFNGAMTNISAMAAPAVAKAYDFKGIRRLCDVGGGHGYLITTLLAAHPHLQGVLYDLPEVVAGYPGGVERLETAVGSFFEHVPPGCDAYVMKHIIHDWSDAKCLQILRNCHRELPADGKLLILEMVVPPGNEPHFSKFADLNMLALTPGGAERTEAQFRELLAHAGFTLSRVIPTESPMCIVEAVKA